MKEWRVLEASRWVLDTICHGVKIPWTRKPPRFQVRGYQLGAAEEMWARAELDR